MVNQTLDDFIKSFKGEDLLSLKLDDFKILRILNLDKVFSKSNNPEILNNSQFVTDNLSDSVMDKLFLNKDKFISYIATCKCGEMSGNSSRGIICPECETAVSDEFVNSLSHDNWLSIPEEISKPVLNPIVYLIFKHSLKYKNKISIIEYILNPDIEQSDDVHLSQIKRGYQNFYTYFDEAVEHIVNYTANRPDSKSATRATLFSVFVKKYRANLFCTKLPILSSALHTISSSNKNLKNVDRTVKDLLMAIGDLTEFGFILSSKSIMHKPKEKRLNEIYTNYINYLVSVIKVKLGAKKGIMRHEMIGARLHWTTREVIVPIVEPHNGLNIHMPWKSSVKTYEFELTNLMTRKYNKTVAQAQEIISLALVKYDDFVNKLFNELINDTVKKPYKIPRTDGTFLDFYIKGLPMFVSRNPTLQHGAIQMFFVDKIKTDVHDKTLGISSIVLTAPHGDYDGDELNTISVKERAAVLDYLSIFPSSTMYSKHKLEMSNNINITGPSQVTSNAWLIEVPDKNRLVIKMK